MIIQSSKYNGHQCAQNYAMADTIKDLKESMFQDFAEFYKFITSNKKHLV